MALEAKHGFRSCFNFVPEWEYRVPDSLPPKLEESGFEVGVHGLKHDGKLYNSKAQFAENALRINEYLKAWKSFGFRSPLMQHRLGWLHQLKIEYDCSTFDTDPFEPEPDGMGTIFPFWVPNPNGAGYVELPYTLPQDFALFTVLGEKNIDIWKKKLDWVAEHGGMALLNTHPDYMCFEGQAGKDEFPISHYEELLTYVNEKYEGAFWAANPLEVARYYRASVPLASRNSRKKICMVSYNSYETDNRVRRYAESLANRGDHVDVIALGGGTVPLGESGVNGVSVFTVQLRERDERHKWTYAWRLLRFLIVSSICLTRHHRKIKYDLVHVHNIPDFMVFAAWSPKLAGAKLILDIHDIVPELFASKFNASARSVYVGFLKFVEKMSAAFVDHVIISNHIWQKKIVSRSVPKEKCSVFLNNVDSTIFHKRERTRKDGKFIVVFPGSYQWHQGIDIAIKAFARLKSRLPNAEFHLYGGGRTEHDLRRLAEQLGVADSVKFCGSLPLEGIADVLANADLGVVPKRADSFGNEAYSTKIMEFMSQGVPAIISRTKIDSFYFNDRVVRFFEPGNVQELSEAMWELSQNKAMRESLIANGYEYVKQNSWELRKGEYLALIDTLPVEMAPRLSGEAAAELNVDR